MIPHSTHQTRPVLPFGKLSKLYIQTYWKTCKFLSLPYFIILLFFDVWNAVGTTKSSTKMGCSTTAKSRSSMLNNISPLSKTFKCTKKYKGTHRTYVLQFIYYTLCYSRFMFVFSTNCENCPDAAHSAPEMWRQHISALSMHTSIGKQ